MLRKGKITYKNRSLEGDLLGVTDANGAHVTFQMKEDSVNYEWKGIFKDGVAQRGVWTDNKIPPSSYKGGMALDTVLNSPDVSSIIVGKFPSNPEKYFHYLNHPHILPYSSPASKPTLIRP